MNVSITIEYYGIFKERAQKGEERIEVCDDAAAAYDDIVRHINARYKISPPFNMMLNKKHMIRAVKNAERIIDGDVVKLFPFYSGG